MKISIFALHLGYGGVEKYVITIANMLAKKHEVEILSTYKLYDKPSFPVDDQVKIKYLMNERPNKEEFLKAKESKNPFKILKEGIYSVRVLQKRKAVNIEAIKNCDADVIISTRSFHNYLIGKYAKKGITLITSEHNHHCGNEKYIEDVCNSVKGFDYLLPISKELTQFYSERLENVHVRFIPFCIDEHKFVDNEHFGTPIFISVGRLSPEKGYLDLIDVFELIHQKNSHAQLHIVGDGEEFDLIQTKIENKKLTASIILHGYMDKDDIYDLMSQSTIYLMTSYTESFGIVLLEAMSCGVPCIAFDSAQGAKEIIHDGIDGLLIKDRNMEEMANKSIELLNDFNTLWRMRNASVESAKLYSYEAFEKAWNMLMDEICEKKDAK